MSSLIVNRRAEQGGDVVYLIPFVFLMLVVSLGLWSGIYSFFGNGYDFREAETDLMALSLQSCLESHDFFVEGFDFYSSCGFNHNVDKEHLIYVKNSASGEEFFIGVLDYLNQCSFVGSKKNVDFPKCKEFELYTEQGGLQVVVGSNQNFKR